MEIEKIEYKGYIINISQSEYCDSPDEWEQESFLVYDHRDFMVERKGVEPRNIHDYLQIKEELKSSFIELSYLEELQDNLKDYFDYDAEYWIFRVYAYIHSGVSLSLGRSEYPFNDRWDVSSTGFVLVKKEHFSEFKRATEIAQSIIDEWNDYLSGNVWDMTVEERQTCTCCGHTEMEVLDSCSCYYGTEGRKQAIEDAKDFIDNLIEKQNGKNSI